MHSSVKVLSMLMIKPFELFTAESREEHWTAVVVSNKHLNLEPAINFSCLFFVGMDENVSHK